MIIRSINESERAAWETLFNAYADFYHVEITTESVNTVWEWIFDPAQDFWCDVVEDGNGNLVGFTQYQLMHRSLGGSMVCYLSDLYVSPDIRGNGTGRALIDNVVQFAKENNVPGVRWLTQENNYAARRLYDTYVSKSDFLLYNVSV
ncbi:MAG: N-acetyltransferase family protein [Granulosicoccus sp.]